MTEEASPRLTSRDRGAERERTARRRRRGLTIAAAVLVVAALVVGQLAFGLITRVVEVTGWTCGRGWDRVGTDELDELTIVRWGTPEARELVDPQRLADLPPGLDQPSLTTYPPSDPRDFNPTLHPLGDGAVLLSDGYTEHTWVVVDARTGEPLWGVRAGDGHDVSTVGGRLTVLGAAGDRTDLTTFDARTGERLSCVRLDGRPTAMADLGDEVAVGLHLRDAGEDGDPGRLVVLDSVTGRVRWDRTLPVRPTALHAAAGTIAASATNGQGLLERPFLPAGPAVVAVSAEDGDELWRLDADATVPAVLDAVTTADGAGATLVQSVSDELRDRDAVGYSLLDATGQEVWSVELARPVEVGSWQSGDVLLLPDGSTSVAVDVGTGERLWEDGPYLLPDDVVVLGGAFVVTDRFVEGGDGEQRAIALVLDARTGEVLDTVSPLLNVRPSDSYLLADTGSTQVVIPLTG